MFDESYCAGMALGPPEVSIEGLNELAGVLTALGTNRKRSAQSRPSNKKEKGVRRSQYQNRRQPVLELEPKNYPALVERNTKGLVEALADLLLEALEPSEATSTNREGVDEHQNHA